MFGKYRIVELIRRFELFLWSVGIGKCNARAIQRVAPPHLKVNLSTAIKQQQEEETTSGVGSAPQCLAASSGSFSQPVPVLHLKMGEADVTLNQTDEKPPDSVLVPGEDSVVWSHEVEVCLFHAMIGHKPVGKKTLTPLAATESYPFSPVFPKLVAVLRGEGTG